MRLPFFLFLAPVLLAGSALAAIPAASSGGGASKARLGQQLDAVREQVTGLQKELLAGFRTRRQAEGQISRIRSLMALQKREREIGLARMKELEATVLELESRRSQLIEKTARRRHSVRSRVASLLRDPEHLKSPLVLDEAGERDVVGRRIAARLAGASLREIEELKIDLADAEGLEKRIQDEKQQLAYLFQDLEEQKDLLELNRQIQVDLIRKEHEARVARLESYRRLKGSEEQLERMLREFNSRRELEQAVERDRATARAVREMGDGAFARLKGSLDLPIQGRVLSKFGQVLDPESQLHVFKKGIDIEARAGSAVRAVAPAKVAYSGELPGYGKVLILDHGGHYYSLCGHLGSTSRTTGQEVAAGDVLGDSSPDGAPVYFEIRSRNIAVNPLQWVSSSFSLSP